jgi:ribosome biogenesis GTPase / thiamine phosphate phosphatase
VEPKDLNFEEDSLESLGWSVFFESQMTEGGRPGRVASANHGRFLVWTASGGEVDASVTGVLRKTGALWPAVGDWVVLRPDGPVIDRVLTRRTKLSRKQPEREVREQVLAANVDVLFIVSGLDRDYNPRRIERFLVMANESGARPVVLLNKVDLAEELGLDLDDIVARTRLMSTGLTVIPISALSDHGLDALPAELAAGQTAALIGSSGVGKSTILNRLHGTEQQSTAAVRASDSRGRHTTTTRQLFVMPGGWLLMDLPGLREVQLWAEATGTSSRLEASFDDIQALAEGCRFRDCTHTAEPGCAVIAAGLEPGRLANYQKMQKELAALERKNNPRLAKDSKAKWKAIEKSVRSHPKRDG